MFRHLFVAAGEGKNKDMIWILDNGHGIDTPGKRAGELYEWLFNRYVMKYLTYALRGLDIPYYILVEDEEDISLRVRAYRANNFAKDKDCKLLSIHGNAFEDESVQGIETFYYSPEGKEMAEVFQSNLIDELGWTDRGVKFGNFHILRETSMPAVLVELGFYTNPAERQKMLDPEYQYMMGDALANAIKTIEA